MITKWLLFITTWLLLITGWLLVVRIIPVFNNDEMYDFRCGSFAKSIQEVHLFLSAAGGKTALHKDPYSNIHCVFNGTKDWITVHPDQTEHLYMSPDSKYEWGGLSEIDVDRVDLEQHPDVAKLNYSKVRLNKGDCIFMPSGKLCLFILFCLI